MICLTGNVHHRSYHDVDTRHAQQTEAQLALRYCDIAARHQVKLTLFVTGKACLEEPDTVAALGRYAHCEIGGHTLCAFRSIRHWLSRCLGGSVLGSASLQRSDIENTITAIGDVTGKRIAVWRNHGYQHDANTYSLLGELGIHIVSDRVATNTTAVERVSQDLLSLPINTLPDHEHVLHGKYMAGRTHFARLEGRRTIQEWREAVEHQVETIEQLGGIATILARPLCMDVADGMQSFDHLCRFLSRYETRWVSEMIHARG
ncbi:MAG: polysaccharide deacetylase family protein [Nitrospira defluvii]|nr:polysaccharide deacetylase family protein [Nitrospira defluvii]